jgi:hypothetical protein
MSQRTRTARKRRTTRKTVKRSRSAGGARVRRAKADDGPNVKRLSRAGLLTSSSDRSFGAAGLERIERLTRSQVQTLIDVARKVGRKPRCWLI